ncbi:efflux RND transporter periplasmic adaptor subunit [Undibacterium oligocarboniphilum]|uniref:Efflux RND transporter periplasmic adaptor subunit n=1 Tax=Undibacterium oligocarboniphilum TaxID=666702 RepID=A0A850QPH0_9BURK|nr:efflux RND transporter periplasmic adaptor subunit [Undibacterium oligocarboniphilum]MBC3870579.1 efflux RND transporter periplasmic adaptor subunit [Undibacterium oligocarboniphilum]NVO78620.1 efflux RND transporter periplasmic adaptor subunit [Undibacterium oligocarboniphilum]
MLNKKKELYVAVAVGLIALGGAAVFASQSSSGDNAAKDKKPPASLTSVTISDQQATHIEVVPVKTYDFVEQNEAVGYIDFNQDATVQVFTPYQGRIRQVFVKAGDDVRKGQALFSVDSPDLVTAESTLISTAGLTKLTTAALERAKKMLETQTAAQKDVDQATADQQTADANFRAARDAVRIFGKSDADIDRLLQTRKVDGELTVNSPLTGKVTARNAAPGLLTQPGNAPAPVTVSDLSTVWMVASVSETDLPRMKMGQSVSVAVMAYPGKIFQGKVNNIGIAIDPATHRVGVRSEIKDPEHLLHPQMLATYRIRVADPVQSAAAPLNALVREGDGTMTAYVTKDGRTFTRRAVQTGLEQEGNRQILSGLQPGEKIAADGAIFLSNMLSLQSR